MALDTAPAPISLRRAVSGRRSDSRTVVLAVNDALAPVLEGQALVADIEAGVIRITEWAAKGSRTGVINEANRLGFRAGEYRTELRRLAEAIEPTGDAA